MPFQNLNFQQIAPIRPVAGVAEGFQELGAAIGSYPALRDAARKKKAQYGQIASMLSEPEQRVPRGTISRETVNPLTEYGDETPPYEVTRFPTTEVIPGKTYTGEDVENMPASFLEAIFKKRMEGPKTEKVSAGETIGTVSNGLFSPSYTAPNKPVVADTPKAPTSFEQLLTGDIASGGLKPETVTAVQQAQGILNPVKEPTVPKQQFTVIDDITGDISSVWLGPEEMIPKGKSLQADVVRERSAVAAADRDTKRQASQDERNRLNDVRAVRGATIQEHQNYVGSDDVKAHTKLAGAFGKMRSAYEKGLEDPSTMARVDHALGVLMQKLTDPDSAVLLGELNAAQQMQALDDRATGLYQKMVGGGAGISTENRAGMMAVAERLYDSVYNRASLHNEESRKRAVLLGLNPDAVAPALRDERMTGSTKKKVVPKPNPGGKPVVNVPGKKQKPIGEMTREEKMRELNE